MKNRSYFKLPNALIRDTALSYSARRVGAALFAYSNALGVCRKSYAQLSRLAGCSVATAVAAVQQLVQAGYVTYCTTSRYCHAISRVGKGKNVYSVSLATLEAGYTFVSRQVFRHELTDAAFVIYMAVLSELGNAAEAWPSISKLQEKTGAARSTVLAGLKFLKRLPSLLVQLCRKRNGAFGCNHYHPCRISAMPQTPKTTANTGVDDTESGQALVSPLPFYHKLRRAICQGLRRIFSFFGGGKSKFSNHSYNLHNGSFTTGRINYIPSTESIATRERVNEKSKISFLKPKGRGSLFVRQA